MIAASRVSQPVQAPAKPGASASARGPETGDPEMEGTAHQEMVTAPLPPLEEGRVENILFHFVFVAPKTSIKEQFPQSLGLWESGVPCITRSLPSSLTRQWVVAQEHPSCPFVEPGMGSSTQL